MTLEATLQAYKPWIRTVASSYAKGDPDLTEEYFQEAWIAVWGALEKRPDASDTHLKMQARKRLNNCYSRGDRTGKPRAAHSTKVRTVPVDDESPIWEAALTVQPVTPDLSYHEDAIVRAINDLSPSKREYIYLRFWKDYDAPALTRHFGYDPVSLWSRPKTGAKALLREELGHLSPGMELA